MSCSDVFQLLDNEQEQEVKGIRLDHLGGQMYDTVCANYESAEALELAVWYLRTLGRTYFLSPKGRARGDNHSGKNILVFKYPGGELSSWFDRLELPTNYVSEERTDMIRKLVLSQFVASRLSPDLMIKPDINAIFLDRHNCPQIIRVQLQPDRTIAINEFTNFLEGIHGSVEYYQPICDNFRLAVRDLYQNLQIDDLCRVYYHPLTWSRKDTVLFLQHIGDKMEYGQYLAEWYVWQHHFRYYVGRWPEMYRRDDQMWERYPDTLWGFFEYMRTVFNHLHEYQRPALMEKVVLSDVRRFVPDIVVHAHDALVRNYVHWKREIFDNFA